MESRWTPEMEAARVFFNNLSYMLNEAEEAMRHLELELHLKVLSIKKFETELKEKTDLIEKLENQLNAFE
jgi:hypothetical protein